MDGSILGAIMLGSKRSGGMYTEEDIRFLDILGPEASIAMNNAHVFDEKNLRVRELTALNQLAYALGANIELESVLDAAMEQVVAVTNADSGSIMLLDEEDRTLSIAVSRGIPQRIVAETRIAVGEGIAGWVAAKREALILVDDTDPRFRDDLNRDEIVSAISAPVICKDTVIGVINVNRRGSAELFTSENLNVVSSFAGQMAVVIENARLYRDLENTILGTIGALAAAVDAKDPYTFGHSNDVTEYAVAIAEKLGFVDSEIQTVRIAATLHDIGKIGIDGAILNKPGQLTDEERAAMNRHPAIGADILAPLDFLRDAVPSILFHHECYSGGGYPSGISGEAIPMGARIISVADSYNAMVSDRPYRKAMDREHAVKELLDNSGTQFDPVVVRAMLDLLAQEKQAKPAQPPVLVALKPQRRVG
jgi:HD-GYP domain-containing protein (c-di-GMP phosphodiesterase class II)